MFKILPNWTHLRLSLTFLAIGIVTAGGIITSPCPSYRMGAYINQGDDPIIQQVFAETNPIITQLFFKPCFLNGKVDKVQKWKGGKLAYHDKYPGAHAEIGSTSPGSTSRRFHHAYRGESISHLCKRAYLLHECINGIIQLFVIFIRDFKPIR
jgi:hypothetical protein